MDSWLSAVRTCSFPSDLQQVFQHRNLNRLRLALQHLTHAVAKKKTFLHSSVEGQGRHSPHSQDGELVVVGEAERDGRPSNVDRSDRLFPARRVLLVLEVLQGALTLLVQVPVAPPHLQLPKRCKIHSSTSENTSIRGPKVHARRVARICPQNVRCCSRVSNLATVRHLPGH